MLLQKSIILFIMVMNMASSFVIWGGGGSRARARGNNNIRMCGETKTLKELLEEKQRKVIQKKTEAGMDLRFRVEAPKIMDDIDVVVDIIDVELLEKKERLKLLLSSHVPEIKKLELIRNAEPVVRTAVLNSSKLMNNFLCSDW